MHVQLEWSEALAQQDWKQSSPRMIYHPAVMFHPDKDRKLTESLIKDSKLLVSCKSQLRNLIGYSESGNQLASYLSKNEASTLFANSMVSYSTQQLGNCFFAQFTFVLHYLILSVLYLD